ncbi:MAG: antitoxin YezG family protein [Methylobacillus sp.]|jgi:hypothetical protein|nr:antitoxin YezG family protein [Methylobacillus sp.]
MSETIIPEAENFYPKIGQLIYDAILDDFDTAWMRVEMMDDTWAYGMFYLKPNGRFQYLNTGLNKVTEKFRELRNCFKSAGCEVWSGATFILSAQGKFSIDYTYEDVSDVGRGSERRKVWIKKYFGDNPVIDWE